MGNIVTPDQGLLPLPPYGITTTPYPWWLNSALAIWALLALLCCWLLLLLYLLRYCCKWCRHRQYATDRKSIRERVFGRDGRRNLYATRNQHFATAPLPPVPPYAVSFGDDFYGDRTAAYVTSGRGYGLDSESFSEEENIQRNITKNFYINEEQNYFIQKDSAIKHDEEIQILPAPTVTTINMAAERIVDNPNWENVNTNVGFNNQTSKQVSTEIVATDPSLLKQNIKYEKPPNIYTHRPVTPEIPQIESRKLNAKLSLLSDDGSTTSEMSGHDSESIYETIRVLTPKNKALLRVEDEDEYKTAGIDEVEIEIKDLVRLQKANPKSTSTYDDIILSTNMSRQHLTPRISSSISSSSTLNNLMGNRSQSDNLLLEGEEEKEETVTETIKTQQIQTTFHQIGHSLDTSAFFIPLTHQENQQNDNKKIIIPVSTSSIHHEEQPALQNF